MFYSVSNNKNFIPKYLERRCKPDHNKFSSLSNKTVVAIFPKLCLWRRSLCSNLGGIDPEKLYRATLSKMKRCRMLPITQAVALLGLLKEEGIYFGSEVPFDS